MSPDLCLKLYRVCSALNMSQHVIVKRHGQVPAASHTKLPNIEDKGKLS